MKRNVGFYQKVRMNPSLSFLVESMLSTILNELKNVASKGFGTCSNKSNNNQNNHDDSHSNNKDNNYNHNNKEHQ